MKIPENVIANADDLGINASVNEAILSCFEKGYINSASLMTNMAGFEGAVQMVLQNTSMQNIGVHVNMAEGKPLTFTNSKFLDAAGNWDMAITGKKLRLLNQQEKRQFLKEIHAQVDKALDSGIYVNHIDSHFHLHTLPCFYGLFLNVAKQYRLNIRLAQTYREGSYFKYWFRQYVNSKFTNAGLNYSACFETVDEFLKRPNKLLPGRRVEVMLHPDIAGSDELTDHVDAQTMQRWLAYLTKLL